MPRLQRPLNTMPPDVLDALNERSLLDAYQVRPPHQQNDYLGWIARARQEDTRTKRVTQMLDELAGGERYMNMAWRPKRRGA